MPIEHEIPRDSESQPSNAAQSALSIIESLPADILLEIIRYIPPGQWASLELVSATFRDTTHEAWRTMDNIRIFHDLFACRKYYDVDCVSRTSSIAVMRKLSLRSTNLSAISGFGNLRTTAMFDPQRCDSVCRTPSGSSTNRRTRYCCPCQRRDDSDWMTENLSQFKKLRRIDTTGAYVRLSDLATFLVESAARDRLSQLICNNNVHESSDNDHDRFADALRNDVDGRKPLKLELLDFERNGWNLIRDQNISRSSSFLETIDVSRLTTFLGLGTELIRRRLSDFLNRSTNLVRLSFSFSLEWDSSLDSPAMMSRKVHEENIAIMKSIRNLEHLESLLVGGDCDFEALSDPDQLVLRTFIDLFRTLGLRRDRENGTLVFKELGLVESMANRLTVIPIGDYLTNLESLELKIDFLNSTLLAHALRPQCNLKRLILFNQSLGSTDDDERLNLSDLASFKQSINIDWLLGCAKTLESLTIRLFYFWFVGGDLGVLSQFDKLNELNLMVMRENPKMRAALNDAILAHWIEDGFGPNLRTMHLDGFSMITTDGLLGLLTKTPQLECLTLSNMDSVSDTLLHVLPTSCPSIVKLRLNRCYKVTRAGVQAVLDGCVRLAVLGFRDREWSPDGWFPYELELGKYRRIKFERPCRTSVAYKDTEVVPGNRCGYSGCYHW